MNMPSILIDTSESGTLVAAPTAPGERIVVLGINISSLAAVVPTLTDGDSTSIWKTLALGSNAGGAIVVPFDRHREMTPGTNKPLALALDGSVAVAGS